jgi:flagellar P-ring protein FlgI
VTDSSRAWRLGVVRHWRTSRQWHPATNDLVTNDVVTNDSVTSRATMNGKAMNNVSMNDVAMKESWVSYRRRIVSVVLVGLRNGLMASVRRRMVLMSLVCCASASLATAEVVIRVADVTKLKGYGVNQLVGIGLVVGLNGTGDSDQYEVTMRALQSTLGHLSAAPQSLADLKDTKNVAIVMLEAEIPEHGAREGDEVDVRVSAIGSAKSLAGGRLIPTPLIYRDLEVKQAFAFASGGVRLTSIEFPTAGIIAGGAVIQEDVLLGFTATGRQIPFVNEWVQADQTYVTFVLDDAHASWALSVAIAEAINGELSLVADTDRVAIAADPKNVVVWVPEFQRQDIASWVRDIEELSTLMPTTEARVTIDRTSGTIVVSGNAQISPAVVSHKGLTVVVRFPKPEPDDPRVETRRFVEVGTSGGAASLADLLQALNQLNVPINDRIAILSELHRAGKLHAKLVFKD